jgi:hypothetical protein
MQQYIAQGSLIPNKNSQPAHASIACGTAGAVARSSSCCCHGGGACKLTMATAASACNVCRLQPCRLPCLKKLPPCSCCSCCMAAFPACPWWWGPHLDMHSEAICCTVLTYDVTLWVSCNLNTAHLAMSSLIIPPEPPTAAAEVSTGSRCMLCRSQSCSCSSCWCDGPLRQNSTWNSSAHQCMDARGGSREAE